MKFQNYLINEANTSMDKQEIDIAIKEVEKILKKDCSQYIKEFETTWQSIYRGDKKNLPSKMFISPKITPHTDRRPRFVPVGLHEFMDGLFNKKFNWKARSSGVFAGGFKTAEWFAPNHSWNNLYYIFPIGQYKYVWIDQWSKVLLYKDFDQIQTLFKKVLDDEEIEFVLQNFDKEKNWSNEFVNKSIQYMLQIKEIIETEYKDSGLSDFLENEDKDEINNFEVIFNCPNGYYLVKIHENLEL